MLSQCLTPARTHSPQATGVISTINKAIYMK
jgi:hypothetical protein